MSAWPQGKGRRIAIGSSGFQTRRNSRWQAPTSAGNRASLSLEATGQPNARNQPRVTAASVRSTLIVLVFVHRQPKQYPPHVVRVYRLQPVRVPTHQLIDLLRQNHDPALPCTCLEGIITKIWDVSLTLRHLTHLESTNRFQNCRKYASNCAAFMTNKASGINRRLAQMQKVRFRLFAPSSRPLWRAAVQPAGWRR